MKIDSSLGPLAPPGLDTPKRAAKPQASGKGDDVQLSLSARLQSMESQEAGPVDSNKVAAIKQAIADGRFTINASAIADRLINSAQELLNKQSKP